MSENLPAEPQHSPVPRTSRRTLRMAAIGGIAAVAIVGGGITAVASASSPSTAGVAAAAVTTAPTTSGSAGSGTATPKPPAEHKPHLAGTVTSVSGTTVQIKDRDGFTRTILLSSKTTYSDGLSAKLAVGTKIHAEGTVDANGTSLDATAVGKDNGPQGGPGGHGGPGGFGPGGPRGDHRPGDGGVPPTGAKPAPSSGASAPSTTTVAPTTS